MTVEEIRKEIIGASLKCGGHLASSLGAVEIAYSLARVFDPFKDRIVWDVGHQAYAWKILTGRSGDFGTLRHLDGVAPFPLPSESAADAAVSGHAGVSVSVAAGIAAARDRRGGDEHVVAVVGDSAFANGCAFEAMNNLASSTKKLIIVLNDNEMSISRPVGAIARLLGRLLASVGYNRAKSAAESAGHRLGLTFLREAYHRLESRVKGLFLGNRFFEQFGARYIGPIDGHSVAALIAAFTVAKNDKRSVVVHVVTKKGRGYGPAEADPETWHGIPAGGPCAAKRGWSEVFGEILSEKARKDRRIVALTAGMKTGTGLAGFAKEFPDRFHDVGIAEGHLVAFAAGLAAGGMRPVVAVYSTFLQRAIDQVLHDVAIAKLPVVFCVDRSGLVGADGVTHQGLYDYAMLKGVPNLRIVQPCDAVEFELLFSEALKRQGPTVIRYPRGEVGEPLNVSEDGLSVQVMNATAPVQVWATGDQLAKAMEVAERTGAGVVYARSLKPFDAQLLDRQRAEGKRIVSLENGCVVGGFGETIGAELRFGWPDEFIPHGSVKELEERYALTVEAIAAKILERRC